MSLFTATTFISYFIPAIDLYSQMLSFNWTGLVTFWVLFFALCTYGNAGWLREKVCTHMCPYARFQSAMFDKDTLLVAYDAKRGENRGRRKRKDNAQELGLGDCVDCNLCVEVCPVGIDIRNGMQYECINCAFCIDACDQTMEKFEYDKGLISYTSEHVLSGKPKNKLNLKLIGYGTFTLIISLLMVNWINSRIPLETSILRDRNALYRVNYQGLVENTYTLKILNKTQQALHYNIAVSGIDDVKLTAPKKLFIDAGMMLEVPVTLAANDYTLDKKLTPFKFIINAVEQPNITLSKETTFFSN